MNSNYVGIYRVVGDGIYFFRIFGALTIKRLIFQFKWSNSYSNY
jgi:hypothetical protein